MKKEKLTKEEKSLLADFDAGNFKPAKSAKKEVKKYKGYANFTLENQRP
ncbi:MAG: hypothetical protein Q8P52_01290 [bacterium]|nr:hypothetical protein [bacterium]